MSFNEPLDALEQMVRDARSVPLSASAVIPRDEALELVRVIRDALPRETERAKEVLSERDAVLAGAEAKAREIIERAESERARLVAKTEVVQAAESEAGRIVSEAEAVSSKLRTQADDYVDAKLANFEILLSKVLRTVGRGREQLQRRLEAAADEVAPLHLEDSGEISGPFNLDDTGHDAP